jgi:hypothetical protein
MTVPADQPRTITIVGRLMMADLSPGVLRCRIEPAGGAPVTLRFPPWLAPQVGRQVGSTVRAMAALPGEDATASPEAELADIAAEVPHKTLLEDRSFWEPGSLDELLRRQGKAPVDLESLAGTWPGDPEDGFEEMIRDIRQETAADPSLEEIAARHGVTEPQDLRELFGKWPGEPDDGFEELIRDIRQRNLVTG